MGKKKWNKSKNMQEDNKEKQIFFSSKSLAKNQVSIKAPILSGHTGTIYFIIEFLIRYNLEYTVNENSWS